MKHDDDDDDDSGLLVCFVFVLCGNHALQLERRIGSTNFHWTMEDSDDIIVMSPASTPQKVCVTNRQCVQEKDTLMRNIGTR